MIRTVLVLCMVLWSQSALAADKATAPRPHVLLISIDGLRPEVYREPDKMGLEVPNLRALAAAGVRADRVLSVFPSVTYPAHTTMVTGVNPDRHGIVSNYRAGTLEWFNDTSEVKAQTLWQAARKAGLRTAAIMWPMTGGADVDWLIVEDHNIRKNDLRAALATGATASLLPDLERKTGFVLRTPSSKLDAVRLTDQASATYTAQILSEHKPDLTLVHFLEADHAQHALGPDDASVRAAFERIDAHIGTLRAALKRAGIADRTDIVITGDHGFAPVHTAININSLLRDIGFAGLKQGRITTDLVTFESQAGSGGFFARPGASQERIAAFEREMRALIDRRYGSLLRYLSAADVKSLGGFPGAIGGLTAAPGYMMVATPQPDTMIATHQYRGMHGYVPDLPEMATGMIAVGPSFREGLRLPLARLIDLAPTLAAILRVDLPGAQGSPLIGALDGAAPPGSPY